MENHRQVRDHKIRVLQRAAEGGGFSDDEFPRRVSRAQDSSQRGEDHRLLKHHEEDRVPNVRAPADRPRQPQARGQGQEVQQDHRGGRQETRLEFEQSLAPVRFQHAVGFNGGGPTNVACIRSSQADLKWHERRWVVVLFSSTGLRDKADCTAPNLASPICCQGAARGFGDEAFFEETELKNIVGM